jgi:hypothetical protein
MATYIGQQNKHVVNGTDYAIKTVDMAGRFYKPDKDANGKWLDTVGWPDTRIMLWVDSWNNQFYKVYNNAEEVAKDWQFNGTFMHHSPRLRDGLLKLFATV